MLNHLQNELILYNIIPDEWLNLNSILFPQSRFAQLYPISETLTVSDDYQQSSYMKKKSVQQQTIKSNHIINFELDVARMLMLCQHANKTFDICFIYL